MKTFGVLFQDGRKELISIVLDDDGNPRIDTLAPYFQSQEFITPTIIPLVKVDKPETGEWNPKVVWFEDHVERQWELINN